MSADPSETERWKVNLDALLAHLCRTRQAFAGKDDKAFDHLTQVFAEAIFLSTCQQTPVALRHRVLAALDEAQALIGTLQTEREDIQEKLRVASHRRTATTAYQQTKQLKGQTR